MKFRRIIKGCPALHGISMHFGAPAIAGLVVLITGLEANARDILRGGAAGNAGNPTAPAGGAPTPSATDAARAASRDILRRNTQTLDSMRAMQAAARAAAATGPNNLGQNPANPSLTLPDVPNGLGTGGLNPTGGADSPTAWYGAALPTQEIADGKTQVTIEQNAQQALLGWETFNVGRDTTLTFDQSAGGANAGQWIAFNKVNDPSGNPTQILGNIKADGQVYLINRNGVIFGGGSQVNARGLTVSSLPINDNLIDRGLLNNPDAQFLFSGLKVPGGSDGTPDFNPEEPPASGRFGDIVVDLGAQLTSPSDGSGNGGRIMLVAPNIVNRGSITTDSGQTVLAAGLQVGLAAHDSNDPSLRGLDVWVGDVGDYAGTVENSGIIQAHTGSVWIGGKDILVNGAIDSSTSVALNGRIDIRASYGAVSNPNFDSVSAQGAGGPIFLNQFTGSVDFGLNSILQILPEYADTKAVPGTALPTRSQINIEGQAIHFGKDSTLFAPNARVNVRAGSWTYRDINGDRTIFDNNGNPEPFLATNYTGRNQRFLFDAGQIHIDTGATLSVAGSVDVFVPLNHTLLTIRLLGSELADSPLQRNTPLRGQELVVDITHTGSHNGKFWIGTPLGDVTGLANLIERNAAQLTAKGGDITLSAGQSLVVRQGATVDVSGGFYNHEGGPANTSFLIQDGRLVPMREATPDQNYVGVFNGQSVSTSLKWGVVKSFPIPLFGNNVRDAFVEGAAGGSLALNSASMALDGDLFGLTIDGPRQRETPAAGSSLQINFEAEKRLPGSVPIFLPHSPTPPALTFTSQPSPLDGPEFILVNGVPAPLPPERIQSVDLSTGLLDENGFTSIEVFNPDGNVTVPDGVTLTARPGGSIRLTGANLFVDGGMVAPGGSISLTAYNLSPSFVAEYNILTPSPAFPFPQPVDGRGLIRLGESAVLSAAGLLTDDRDVTTSFAGGPVRLAGGSVSLRSFSADLTVGSIIDVSGSARVSNRGSVSYGAAGAISIVTGNDPSLSGVTGGELLLGAQLSGFSGAIPGSLAIQAGRIEIGSTPAAGALHLDPDFFNRGGFGRFDLTGIGGRSDAPPPPGLPESYEPAVRIAPGSVIAPVVKSLFAVRQPDGEILLEHVIAEQGLRSPARLSFTALGNDDPFTLNSLEIRGDIRMEAGSSIVTDPGGAVSFKGGTVTLLGSVTTPGGNISIAGAGAFPLTSEQQQSVRQALTTVHIGSQAHLSAAGAAVSLPDIFGRNTGRVLDGGNITVSGNIVAENGAFFDVSGTSATFDLDPSQLASGALPGGPQSSGVNEPPSITVGIPTRIDSNGGLIDLTGSQMLLSDATLRGLAGGDTAVAGTLAVSSGRYYNPGDTATGADINLIVSQSGDVIRDPAAGIGIGRAPRDQDGQLYANLGFFSLSQFESGGFHSLELGGKYVTSGAVVPYGGNIRFDGPIDLEVPGMLRLAAGGVVSATDSVGISASYLAVGQDFLPPANPGDVITPFQVAPSATGPLHQFAPTFGTGSLDLRANLIDVGTLATLNIGNTAITANGGDIRGNGFLGVAGDLTLTAARIYPTTLSNFSVFAYDPPGAKSSVTINASGRPADVPLSVGGRLEVYASNIHHTGFLHAPMGTITLGWDGTDLNPDTPALDTPFNLVTGTRAPVPVTESLVIGDGAVTSVSAVLGENGRDWLAPFGISPDGQNWIDPRGVNVTLAGLPGKFVNLTARDVTLEDGSDVDLRGGGDLFASRWILGSGGSVDLLGSPSSAWASGSNYSAGNLVSFGGRTWSARVAHSGQQPVIGPFWTQVEESYAIIPTGGPAYFPQNPFNTGTRAGQLGGDPGFSTAGLTLGDTITLEASGVLAAGTYVLLPKRYALLPGAMLITPKSGGSNKGSVLTPEGASIAKGRLGNAYAPNAVNPQWSLFEIATTEVLAKRAEYQIFTANESLTAAAANTGSLQALPNDGGSALIHGNESLFLAGQLLSASPGRSTTVDLSSFANIRLTSGEAMPTAGGVVNISTDVVNSWNVGSLTIGGIRRTTETAGTVLDVRTSSLTVDNSGEALIASDIVLTSRGTLELAAGANLLAVSTEEEFEATALTVSGDGALIRASADADALVTRSTSANTASASLADGVAIKGASILIDSSGSTNLAANVELDTGNLTLSSGLIRVAFDGAPTPADPAAGLILQGETLARALDVEKLTLRSYQTIDFYGSGTIDGPTLQTINLLASGIRGFDNIGGVQINAGRIRFENTLNAAQSAASTQTATALAVNASTIRFGPNDFRLSGFSDLQLNATGSIITEGAGSFTTAGSITANTPLVTGTSGSAYAITAGGTMTFENTDAIEAATVDQLGARLALTAASIQADTSILLPSGILTLTATNGDTNVGGLLSTEGSAKEFNDLVRYADGGVIRLEALAGDVTIDSQATVSVAGHAMGGNAGTFAVATPQGLFASLGTLRGEASEGFSSGSFLLDVSRLDATGPASLGEIDALLFEGGFRESLDFRVRNGDVLIDSLVLANSFALAADRGSVLVTGTIDSSGVTGGSISLAARDDLTIADGAVLTVAADSFNSAGKGGAIRLEAGTSSGGVANPNATLAIQQGSLIDMSVDDFAAGSYLDNESSASLGRFTGTLHLRAPRSADDLGIAALEGSIVGASSILAEGYRIYQPADGTLNIALRNQIDADARAWLGAPGVASANETAMIARLLSGNPEAAALGDIMVIAPGVEIINPTGDLTLGLANNTQFGTSNTEAHHTADWDLSGFRYGSRSAPGVLTLRAAGDLVFNNTLSDGFNPIAQGSSQVFANNGHSLMWLAPLATIRDSLPINTQSWSYRLTAGADLSAGDFRDTLPDSALALGKGSVLVGEFYPAVPNTLSSGNAAAIGTNGQTADSIRISSSNTNTGNRFEVIRTGTGDITVSAGRDIQLRNTFSSIYTAGVALPDPTRVFESGDFFVPIIPTALNRHPSQTVTGTLGIIQQLYGPAWSMAGGDISLEAGRNIGRYTLIDGVLTAHSSRQMPTNWLFRRGYVDPSTGRFAADGGFGTNPNINNAANINDEATSTTWWIDFSNFFQSVGTLGGGNVSMTAGNDVVNMDAVAPTNARMAGRTPNPAFGSDPDAPEFINLAPSATRMIEFGGGDIQIASGRNIDGGLYYVERGHGMLTAGGEIKTNAARSPSLDILNNTPALDPLTWMPTMLFVGKSGFDVTAAGNILLGPATNPFLLPQGLNNKYWYKTYFQTFSENARVNVVSLGGGVTHRTKINLPFGASPANLLGLWYQTQLFYNGVGSTLNASHYQPWLRLAELDLNNFGRIYDVSVPSLSTTAMGGDVRLVGDITLAPSPSGTLELAASGSVIGINPVGPGRFNNANVMVWSSSTVNLSDAPANAIPSYINPLGYQTLAGRDRTAHFESSLGIFEEVNRSLVETGSFTGEAATVRRQAALHDSRLQRMTDSRPLQIHATGGDITGFTLFSPKASRIIAERDLSDVALYLQNLRSDDISLVSAGRDIIPFNAASPIRSVADNLLIGNFIGDSPSGFTSGGSTKAMAGDIRISGPGVLEVLAGRNIDLGSGANFTNGTGTGITAIGNLRNPFLPFSGADIIAMAGVTAASGVGPATGLAASTLDFAAFIDRYLADPDGFDSEYLSKLQGNPVFEDLTAEQQAVVALEKFYRVLLEAGRAAGETDTFDPGYEAIATLFGENETGGEVLMRSREIRTITGGTISLGVPDGGIAMASEIFGNPLAPPGIVTEFGGGVNTFTDQSVDLGQARIFTLRGGDIVMWSSEGNIAAGSSPRTVVTAPPTRVVIDPNSATVQTDLGGLATGGGIGVLASVEGVEAGNVDLIAPKGFVDAGDAGIRVSGNLNIAANTVINAGNIAAGGSISGSAVSAPAAPSVAAVTTASSASSAATTTATPPPAAENQQATTVANEPEAPSVYTVEVIGYGGGGGTFEEEEEDDEDDDDNEEKDEEEVDP